MSDHVALFILYAVAGGIAGFIRFLESKRQFGWRTISTSILLSSLLSTVILGWWFEDEIVNSPARCLAIALAIGYTQPNVAYFMSLILNAKGISSNKP